VRGGFPKLTHMYIYTGQEKARLSVFIRALRIEASDGYSNTILTSCQE